MSRRPISRLLVAVAALLAVATGQGCALETARLEVIEANSDLDPNRAQKHYLRGVKLLEHEKPVLAKKALQKAILADPNHGPAHNNLGLLYFDEGDLFQAANEFDRAIDLLPDQAEPINNLGLTLEQAGRLDEAVEMYMTALEMEPDSGMYLGNLARAQLRRGDPPAAARPLLERLLFVDTRPEWIEWAELQLHVLIKDETPTEAPSEGEPNEANAAEELLPIPQASEPRSDSSSGARPPAPPPPIIDLPRPADGDDEN